MSPGIGLSNYIIQTFRFSLQCHCTVSTVEKLHTPIVAPEAKYGVLVIDLTDDVPLEN